MSEVQLNRLLAQNERVREELENSKNIIKVSEACQVLIDHVKKTADPFGAAWDHSAEPNPWQKSPGGGPKCLVI